LAALRCIAELHSAERRAALKRFELATVQNSPALIRLPMVFGNSVAAAPGCAALGVSWFN